MYPSKRCIASVATVFCVLRASAAHADDLPKGTETDASVSKGTTDVAKGGFEGAAKRDADSKDATELTVSAGALSSSGNSTLLAVTAASLFRLRRGDSQASAAAAGNYSTSKVAGAEAQTTVENLQGKARYDRFFLQDFTAFLGVQGRRDRFQGLDVRLQIDPGLGYYWINTKNILLWGEVGYDFLYDVRRDDARAQKDAAGKPIVDATGAPVLVDKTNAVHSGRLFLGYTNKLTETAAIAFGIEYLQSLTSTTVYKINADAAVSAKIGKGFSLASAVSVRYDHDPLPGKEKLDTVTTGSLVYTVL